jgi:ubiquinone/menaquinone biosynthesis C-methylase UbiE
MPDFDETIQITQSMYPLRQPVMRAAIQALNLPPGSRGLDAGCGTGFQSILLAEAIGAQGHVAGLDLSPEMLAYAEKLVDETGLAGRVSFRQGDVRALPFEDDSFDWAWSADCVGYAPIEPLPLIRELRRVVKPGGLVAILAWSAERLLPGYPRLEARLGATAAGMAPFAHGRDPGTHFLRALGWFRQADLVDATAQTFVGQAAAPLSTDIREALTALFEMRWPGAEAELSPEDAAEYRKLCLPGSDDFILNAPDYYAFFTYTMYSGRVQNP